ncbi:tRNA (adenosine(37)-N6)-threonylcarbamoyltransferase complex dimerization subunit type 1 TsaB [Cellulomonas humilata]|uniref:tRNA threonylcarbamoyladenosine biosynthesis protein TsaB n=1 Tax=Cellulomonas humilata TaxID=144055 RepID=A0ABU0ECE7_9CELL|nr:tRNA (adenosine(37)-N6)-threonylcarbamoyltransferase complex dimerization subunit type 1 TsaB [Cellulomonas humilata]MDQ0372943.1 tRNA threonylcarbamoyladenosine biosynthesis protein TsaB [Cellulomonas humilata]
MPVLALDTSAAVAVALTDDAGALLAERSDRQQRHHAELLTPMIAAVLADAGVDRRELTSVVVGTGPAPFTGLRVGLVTARTLALALGIPAHGVPSLDAVALRASRTLPPGTDVLVATDARRREVYWSLYRVVGAGRIEVLVAPEVAAAADVASDERTAGALVVGRGALLYADAFAAGTESPLLDPDPAELARLALERVAEGRVLGTEPLYLRRPDAVPQAARKRVLG